MLWGFWTLRLTILLLILKHAYDLRAIFRLSIFLDRTQTELLLPRSLVVYAVEMLLGIVLTATHHKLRRLNETFGFIRIWLIIADTC